MSQGSEGAAIAARSSSVRSIQHRQAHVRVRGGPGRAISRSSSQQGSNWSSIQRPHKPFGLKIPENFLARADDVIE